MITQAVTFTISGSGTAPYTYQFLSSNSCATFANGSGTALYDAGTGLYAVSDTIYFENETCIGVAVVSVQVTDANGCVSTTPLVITNACAGLTLNAITNPQLYDFSTLGSGGSGSYRYDWLYPSAIFDLAEGTDAVSPLLELELKETTVPLPPFTATITCTLTDLANGCTEVQTYLFTFQQLAVPDFALPSSCKGEEAGIAECYLDNKNLNPESVFVGPNEPDFTTLEVNAPSAVTVVNDLTGYLYFTCSTAGTYAITYRVKDTEGYWSNWGTITITFITCSATSGTFIDGGDVVFQMTIDDGVPDVFDITVPYYKDDDSVIDWGSAKFDYGPTAGLGTAVLTFDSVLHYTVASVATTAPDAVQVNIPLVANPDKYFARSNIVIMRNREAAVVANNDTVCTSCNTRSALTDLTTNDVGAVWKYGLVFVTTSAVVGIAVDSDNDYYFTPSYDATASTTLQYQVPNTQGALSNTADVTIQNVCAGVPLVETLDITCFNPLTLSLTDYVEYIIYGAGAGWNEPAGVYTGLGGVIGNPTTTGDLDFTAIADGTYTFVFDTAGTAPCGAITDSCTIDILKNDAGTLTFVSSVDNTDGTFTHTCTIDGVNSAAQVTVAVDGVAATFETGPTIVGTTLTFVALYENTGNNTVVVTAITVCGASINTSDLSNNATGTVIPH